MKRNLRLALIASLWANFAHVATSTSLVNNLINIPKFALGRCPRVGTVPDFDTARYLGAWYSQMQVPTTFQPADMRCVRALYGDRGDGTVSVYNTGTNGKGVLVEICGYAYQPDPENNPGKLAVRFPVSPVDGDYQVLEVDYTSHVVVYSCSQILFFKYELGWILTREPTVSEELVDRALSVYKRNNITLDLVVTEQKDSCVYEPPDRCIDEELPSNFIEGILSTVRLYLRAAFRSYASVTDKVG